VEKKYTALLGRGLHENTALFWNKDLSWNLLRHAYTGLFLQNNTTLIYNVTKHAFFCKCFL